MAYTPLFKPSRAFFDLPEIDNILSIRPEYPVSVILLVKTSQQQRDEIKRLLDAGQEHSTKSDTKLRKLEIIPWLRSHVLSEDDVLGAVPELVHRSCAAHIIIDRKGLDDHNCIITYSPDWKGLGYALHTNETMYQHEFARVRWEEARFLVSVAGQNKSWFPDRLSEDRRLRIESSEQNMGDSQEWEIVDSRRGYEWPSHIPADLKLNESSPTIISLIHLLTEELHNIETAIVANKSRGHAPPNIINWPAHVEPGSEQDMWYIFDAMKPDFISPYDEVFGFFVDSMYLDGPDRKPELLMVARTKVEDPEEAPAAFVTENSMEAMTIRQEGFLQAYSAAFNPTGNRDGNQIHYNGAMRSLNLSTGSFSPFAIIANPDVPVLVARELPIFVLQPITPTQAHILRSTFPCFDGTNTQLTLVPDGDGTITRLLQYLQSPEFIAFNRRPPADFVAIDATSMSSIMSAKSEKDASSWSWSINAGLPNVLLGTGAQIWHEDNEGRMLAEDHVGYKVMRCEMYGLDEYQDWNIRAWESRGLGLYFDDVQEVEDGLTGAFYWGGFEKDDVEVESRVQIRDC